MNSAILKKKHVDLYYYIFHLELVLSVKSLTTSQIIQEVNTFA